MSKSFETVQKLLAEQLHIADASIIKPETDITRDLKADSLDLAEMLLNVETVYNVTVPNEVAMNMKTVNDLVSFLDSTQK
ncbi:MAG: acyl carrier protein [Clostridiales bacterium]|jgi:acyl carrier protein|nr:acyl carrier protein [Clostridiales bacterium]